MHERNPIPKPEITEIGGYPVIPEVINGVKINFVGVSHDPEFLEKHSDELKSVIHNSSLVISEAAIFDTSKFELQYTINPGAKIFFNGIADIAKKSPKKITIVDPGNAGTYNFDGALQVFTLTHTGIYMAKKAHNILYKKENLTRRTFLHGLALTTAALVTGVQGPLTNELLSKTGNWKPSSTHGLDDTVAFSDTNYRNAFSAYAIDNITKLSPNPILPITHISGAAHPKNIISYLKENKTEGQIKKRFYDLTPYHLLGRQSIRNYEFTSSQWQLKSEIRP